MDSSGEAFVTQTVANLVVNCPLFLALAVGLGVGAVAFVRGNRLAGSLAFAGFAIVGLLLLLSTFLGGGQMAMVAYEQGMEPARVGLLVAGISCLRSLVEMVGLLCIVGAIAAYAFRARKRTA